MITRLILLLVITLATLGGCQNPARLALPILAQNDAR
jgi:hypothetical protein